MRTTRYSCKTVYFPPIFLFKYNWPRWSHGRWFWGCVNYNPGVKPNSTTSPSHTHHVHTFLQRDWLHSVPEMFLANGASKSFSFQLRSWPHPIQDQTADKITLMAHDQANTDSLGVNPESCHTQEVVYTQVIQFWRLASPHLKFLHIFWCGPSRTWRWRERCACFLTALACFVVSQSQGGLPNLGQPHPSWQATTPVEWQVST